MAEQPRCRAHTSPGATLDRSGGSTVRRCYTSGIELLSTCDEAALVVTVLVATVSGACARPARRGIALVLRRARENILSERLQNKKDDRMQRFGDDGFRKETQRGGSFKLWTRRCWLGVRKSFSALGEALLVEVS